MTSLATAMTLLAATPTQTWQTGEPPHDREVIIFGNISYHDEEGGYSDPIVTPARWSNRCNDWLNQDNMTIRVHVEETLVIHHWIEMPPVSNTPEVTVPPMAETLSDGSRVPVHPAADSEQEDTLADFFAEERRKNQERREAVAAARPALERLCQVMQERSGQPYKVRALLYSLWNGEATGLIDVLGLDWQIRKDICAVTLAFGFEEPGNEFFYKAIREAITKAGQWDWFIEAGGEA